ncbi:class I SAM-dependent methyltransferase [Herbiconiux sp. CPCC 205763]|uniref:Class I SAM-dependent methyltransferase n=1 Tax=Herbiconiux aconitum TaxID=2970913 RepID=A0ABT2GLI8_9MICO|nr:class I SAM-dependent methyltransferase [Herbiconiux aconitum]MCS5717078.1 class I SAM-dependent methyltransferase [Herbiconiux aconitum]
MSSDRSFDDLLGEGAAVPTAGWDFSWFEGRATEERPSWGYAGLAADRIASADAVLDIQTGGAEVFAGALAAAGARDGRIPQTVWATEGYPPNLTLARERLELFRGEVVEVAENAHLPFADERFDLALSRHPQSTNWVDIARVLHPGGTVLTQQVAAGSNRELYEFFLGPQPVDENTSRSLANLVVGAQAAGLRVVDALHESTKVEFFDVAAVVYFLRKVFWTVPDFAVERYRDRLAAVHARIQATGSFVSHSERALIEARKQ